MERLAIYLRLSMEDEGNKDESNSISNQRKQIYEYLHHDSELCQYEVVEFCDDGYSGTNMERPGMQKLLKEVKENNIRCIIVKDMSRFSRDYIEMGSYLNQIFPFIGIRFIAINDCYDSRGHQGNTIEIDTAFQTLLYDLYSKDVSMKVKASIENQCANGEYAFGQVPFGYEKSKEVKNAVVVNPKEAEVVLYIFELAVQGKSSTQIAKQLYEEKLPTIMQMRKGNKAHTDGKTSSWSPSAVRNILNNRFYLGEMVYGKTASKSVGSKKGSYLPREEWKVIQNHHEPLITEEIFEKVSSFKPGHSTKRNRKKHLLTGKLYCGGCGYSMNYKPIQGRNKYRRFECRKHSILQIPECCTYMRAEFLEETVLLMLNQQLMVRGNGMKQKESLLSYQKSAIHSLKKQQEECRIQMKLAGAKKDKLYEEYALGKMTREEYQKKANELTDEISLLSVNADEIASKLATLESEEQKVEEDMKQVIRYAHIEELTQDIVDTFIKKVYVSKNNRVEIEWDFSMDRGTNREKQLSINLPPIFPQLDINLLPTQRSYAG